MRLTKYKCPNDSLGYGCLLEMDGTVCINCGHEVENTIWESIYDLYFTLIPYNYRPKNIYRKFKNRFIHKWTTIKPRTLDNGWCDYSHLVPEMIFEMNTRFVENEIYPQCNSKKDWECQKEHNPQFYKAWKKLVKIHAWWISLPPDGPEFYKDKETKKEWDLEAEEEFGKLTIKYAKTVVDCSPWMWT